MLDGFFIVASSKIGRIHKYAYGAVGWIEHLAATGFNCFQNQLHDGRGREIFAALLHEYQGEVAHEIFKIQIVSIARYLQVGKQAHQFPPQTAGQIYGRSA